MDWEIIIKKCYSTAEYVVYFNIGTYSLNLEVLCNFNHSQQQNLYCFEKHFWCIISSFPSDKFLLWSAVEAATCF